MKRIKICHISSTRDRNDPWILRKCDYLKNEGYKVSYLINDEQKSECINGVQIYSTGKKFENRKERMMQGVNCLYAKALKIDADIYQLHDPELLRVAVAIKRQGKKVVFDSHEDYYLQIREKPYIPKILRNSIAASYRCFETLVLKKIDGVMFPGTNAVKNPFEGRTKHFAYANNVPSLEEIAFAQSGLPKERAVCYSGTLTEDRGITNLVKAADLANVKLFLAGKFTSDEYREKMLSMKEWRCVEYLGYVGRKEIYEMYSRSRIGMSTLLPVGQYDKSSNLPTKAYEYMGCGLPVILSDFPYNRRMIEKYQFGEVVDPCNVAEMAEKIRRLIDDEKKCKEMGQRGEALIRNKLNFGIEGKNMIRFYDEILGNS